VRPIAWPSVTTNPQVPLAIRGTRVAQPFRWIPQQGVALEIGDAATPKLGIAVSLVPRSVRLPKVDLELRSGRPLEVRFGSIQATTPAQIEVDLANTTLPLYLEDPETHGLLEVRFR
jgi:hypothetical protein